MRFDYVGTDIKGNKVKSFIIANSRKEAIFMIKDSGKMNNILSVREYGEIREKVDIWNLILVGLGLRKKSKSKYKKKVQKGYGEGVAFEAKKDEEIKIISKRDLEDVRILKRIEQGDESVTEKQLKRVKSAEKLREEMKAASDGSVDVDEITESKVKAVLAKLDADSLKNLVSMRSGLTGKGVPQVSIDTIRRAEKQYVRYKIKTKELKIFSHQLSILLDAGVSIIKAVRILKDRATKNKTLNKVLGIVLDDINSGETLSYSLSKFPKVFNDFYVAMVSVGESSGSLHGTFKDIAYYLDSNIKIRAKIIKAAIYPLVILVVLILMLFFGSLFFIPMFSDLLYEFDVDLPWLTVTVFAVSEKVPVIMGVSFVLAGVVLLITKVSNFAGTVVNFLKDVLGLRLPVLKKIMLFTSMYYFSYTLSIMTKNGIRLLDGLSLAKGSLGNNILRKEIDKSVVQVRDGVSLSQALSKQPHFDSLFCSMLFTGEESGKLVGALKQISDYYSEEASNTIDTAMQFIEPLMLLAVLAVVIPVIFAIFIPILDISSGAGVY